MELEKDKITTKNRRKNVQLQKGKYKKDKT